ncbi:MAG TPA: ThiF family adenylyltransferase [Candidatus Angelobacter sp.]|nr:ThiF family adenylyltransferase [Candidatus Angelobacter sp.]
MKLKLPITLTIDEVLFNRLHQHLFPGDFDEHGAVIAAGIAQTPNGTRLLAREVFLAKDGVDYIPGTRGYRALTANFVAEKSDFCSTEGLCYLAIHNHGGFDSVGFSPDDVASHKRGYPALLQISNGIPVGALVFAKAAVAGEIWTTEGVFPLKNMKIVGKHTRLLYPSPQDMPRRSKRVYDRHARLFGDAGQEILRGLKIVIIGLGGGGSLLNEWLAKLGVGHIVAIDFDRIDITNLPRVVGATRWDARTWLTGSRWGWLQRLGKRLAAHKVHIAKRVAKKANPSITYDALVADILDSSTAMLVRDADFIFLATDSIRSRLVFNALVHQYVIPGVQIGAKVTADKYTREVANIFTATRLVLPGLGGGCLDCAGAIPASRLNSEGNNAEEQRAQNYVDDPQVTEPSVITLNVQSAAQAATDLMMMFTGLFEPNAEMGHIMNFARERRISFVEPKPDPFCLDCGTTSRSRKGRGDAVRLPCRV